MNHKAVACVFAFAIYLVQSSFATDINPVQLSASGDPANDVAVSGSNVVMCLGDKGISILDASDPLNGTGTYPQIRSTLNTPGYASGVAFSGNLALIADSSAGLEIVDVTSQTSPKIVGTYFTDGNCNGVTVQGNIAYLAEADFGLEIVDFSNPSQPTRVGGYNTFGTATAVSVSGHFAYVADGDDGLVIIDVSDPSNPRRVGGYDRLPAWNVTAVGTRAYVSSDGPLITFDISNSTEPLPLSSFALPGNVSAISVNGSTGYIVSGTGGFHIVDLSDPFSPKLRTSNSAASNVVRIAVSGPLAFVADQGTNAPGLRIVSIANPAAMDIASRLPISSNIRDIAASGNYVCVLDGRGLEFVDASDPRKMRVAGTYTGFPSATKVLASGHAAFLMGNHVESIDFSDPSAPVVRSTLGGAADMRIAGNRLYFLGGGIAIYSFSDRGDLNLVSSFAILDATDRYFVGRTFAVSGTNILVEGDILFKNGPSVYFGQTMHGDTSGNFIPEGPGGSKMESSDTYFFTDGIRISDSGTLQAVSYYNLDPIRFTVSSNLIYSVHGKFGVQVARSSGTNAFFYNVGGAGLLDATTIVVGASNIFVGAGTNGLYALTPYRPAIQLQTEITTNHLPRLKIFAPIGSSGTLQRSRTLTTFTDLSQRNFTTTPWVFDDTNSPRAFYRFVSP